MVWYSNGGQNTGSLDDQANVHNLNTILVRNSDPHCIKSKIIGCFRLSGVRESDRDCIVCQCDLILIFFSRSASKDVPITLLMGNQASVPASMGNPDGLPPRGGHAKVEAIGSLRRTGPVPTGAPRRPMPDEAELERRFNEVLLQMDLPPDRAKVLKSFDNAKKWDIICDREQVI